MTNVSDIEKYIDSIAPFETMEAWDNSGFQLGDRNSEVKRCVLTLDITEETAAFAMDNSAELILSHHPLIFTPLSNIPADAIPAKLIRNSISVISAHTCFDKAKGGISEQLALRLGLSDVYSTDDGFVAVGELKEKMNIKEFASFTSHALGCAGLRYTDIDADVKRVAVCGGAGEDFLELAKSCADCFVTGDVKYHTMMDAAQDGYPVISAGHFETEYGSFIALIPRLQEVFPDVEFLAAPQKNPVAAV